MAEVPPRRATLVLVTRDGRVLGRLPELPVAWPWWPEAAPVVEAARAAWGLEVVVLRLLDSELPVPHGGGVTYLAEVVGEVPARAAAVLGPVEGALADVALREEPLRRSWARPGGPAADVAWAEGVLADAGLARAGRARQVRTWNLSSIWDLALAGGGSAWLKVVPPFFAHEGAMLRRLAGGPVPRLLGTDGPRVLLAEVEGEDRYGASIEELLAIVDRLVGIQAGFVGASGELLSMGLPDWRGPALAAAIEALAERRGPELERGVRDGIRRVVDGLPARLEALVACGLPDTLVHGDAHPGNARGVPGRPATLVLLDWGDCGVGHPLLDLPAFMDVVPGSEADAVRAYWMAAWRRAVHGCEPERAAELIAPIAAARQALIYQGFLDGIEPVERRYHESDVPAWLARAAAWG